MNKFLCCTFCESDFLTLLGRLLKTDTNILSDSSDATIVPIAMIWKKNWHNTMVEAVDFSWWKDKERNINPHKRDQVTWPLCKIWTPEPLLFSYNPKMALCTIHYKAAGQKRTTKERLMLKTHQAEFSETCQFPMSATHRVL